MNGEVRKYRIGGRVTAMISAEVLISEGTVRQHFGLNPDEPLEDAHWDEYAISEADADFEIDDIENYDRGWKAELK